MKSELDWNHQHTVNTLSASLRQMQAERDRLADRLAEVRAALEQIVEPTGDDAGLILLSDESPTHWSEEHQCQVYEHQYFSPLGDALVAAWKLTKGTP